MSKYEQGFTLLEVLVAMALLGIAMMSVFAIYTQCTFELKRAKNRTCAVNSAQDMLEIIETSPYDLFTYHGLRTTSVPAAGNPARSDMLRWTSALQAFPGQAVGTISVIDDPFPYAVLVTVTLSFENYGRMTMIELTRQIPQPTP